MLYPSTCCICWYRKKYVFKTGKKVNGPHQVHRKDVDHHLRLASSLVVSFYAPYPYKQRRRGVASPSQQRQESR